MVVALVAGIQEKLSTWVEREEKGIGKVFSITFPLLRTSHVKNQTCMSRMSCLNGIMLSWALFWASKTMYVYVIFVAKELYIDKEVVLVKVVAVGNVRKTDWLSACHAVFEIGIILVDNCIRYKGLWEAIYISCIFMCGLRRKDKRKWYYRKCR